MSVCYIFSGGVMNDGDIDAFSLPEPDFVICADAGYVYALRYGFEVDCLMGDFDTLGRLPEAERVKEILKFKCEKDDTDTMLAARLAVERNFDRIYIFGALGGRFDHTFSNIQTLNFIASHKKQGIIISENEYITVLCEGSYTFEKKDGYSFSAFSLSDNTEGVCEKGYKYPLENAALSYDFPLGVCNEILSEKAEISFSKGRLLIVISKKQNLFCENE